MKSIKLRTTSSKKFSPVFSGTLWAALILLLLLWTLTNEYVLPRNFFYDSGTIIKFIKLGAEFSFGDSYASTAALYSFFGMERNSLTFSLVTSSTIFLSFNLYLRKSKARSLDIFEFSLLSFLAFLSITFMSMLNKDFIVLLFIAPFIYFAKRGTTGLIMWSIFALVYAFYFRTYWFIFLAMFWGTYFIFRTTKKPLTLVAAVLLSLLALSLVFSSVLGVGLDNFRVTINDIRIQQGEEDARTMILPWIAGGGAITSWLNTIITWATLMIPIPLLIMLTPYYITITAFILLLYFKFWNKTLAELRSRQDPTIAACASLIISFTATQSIFEPDYGSYVRHLSPFFPIFFYVILKNQKSNALSKPEIKPSNQSTTIYHTNKI